MLVRPPPVATAPFCIFGCKTPVAEASTACLHCAPLLSDDARCACGSEWPIKMVAGEPTCTGCLLALKAAAIDDCYGCAGTGVIRGFGRTGQRCLCVSLCSVCERPVARTDNDEGHPASECESCRDERDVANAVAIRASVVAS